LPLRWPSAACSAKDCSAASLIAHCYWRGMDKTRNAVAEQMTQNLGLPILLLPRPTGTLPREAMSLTDLRGAEPQTSFPKSQRSLLMTVRLIANHYRRKQHDHSHRKRHRPEYHSESRHGQDLLAALVVNQPNAIVNVTGIGNLVLLEGADDSIVLLTGINNESSDFGSNAITGNGNIAEPSVATTLSALSA
jgi:hypothetical protein